MYQAFLSVFSKFYDCSRLVPRKATAEFGGRTKADFSPSYARVFEDIR
jgi:hypothetical protein